MEAMCGVRPATEGSVLFNSLDLKSHFHSLKQSIGYVPQDDIIHRELSVYRTLYHVAKLRLSKDASTAEIRKTIDEVLDVTGWLTGGTSPSASSPAGKARLDRGRTADAAIGDLSDEPTSASTLRPSFE